MSDRPDGSAAGPRREDETRYLQPTGSSDQNATEPTDPWPTEVAARPSEDAVDRAEPTVPSGRAAAEPTVPSGRAAAESTVVRGRAAAELTARSGGADAEPTVPPGGAPAEPRVLRGGAKADPTVPAGGAAANVVDPAAATPEPGRVAPMAGPAESAAGGLEFADATDLPGGGTAAVGSAKAPAVPAEGAAEAVGSVEPTAAPGGAVAGAAGHVEATDEPGEAAAGGAVVGPSASKQEAPLTSGTRPTGDEPSSRLSETSAGGLGSTAKREKDEDPSRLSDELSNQDSGISPIVSFPDDELPADDTTVDSPDADSSDEDENDEKADGGEITGGPAESGAAKRGEHREKTGARTLLRARSPAALLIGLLIGLLGFGLAVQVRSNTSTSGLPAARQEDLVRILDDLSSREDRLRRQIAGLEAARTRLSSTGDKSTAALAEARTRSTALGILAGTLPAQGPGIELTLTDPSLRLAAEDLLDAVEELRAAGAEAIQVGGVRIGLDSAFTSTDRGIAVDGVPLAAPYVILAIGDPPTLATAMDIPGGVSDTASRAGGVARIAQRDLVKITVLRVPRAPRYAEPTD